MGLGLDLVGREPESGYGNLRKNYSRPPVLVIDILVSLDPISSCPLVTVITAFLVTVITAQLLKYQKNLK